MSADVLRPAANSTQRLAIMWFEYLMKPDILEEHLQKHGTDSAVLDLFVKFISVSVEPPKDDSVLPKLNRLGVVYSKRQMAIEMLALKVFAYWKWNLEEIIMKVPLQLQYALLRGFLYLVGNKGADKSVTETWKHPGLDFEALNDTQTFAISLYHRWALMAVMNHHMIPKNHLSTTTPVVESSDEIMTLINASEEESCNILQKIANIQKEYFKFPSFHSFVIPAEFSDVPLEWEACVFIPAENFRCQLLYDVGVYKFYREKYSEAAECFSRCKDLFCKSKFSSEDKTGIHWTIDMNKVDGYICACKGGNDASENLTTKFLGDVSNNYIQCSKTQAEPTTKKTECKKVEREEPKGEVLGFLLWKNSQHDTPTSWKLYQRWCSLPEHVRSSWIKESETLMKTAKKSVMSTGYNGPSKENVRMNGTIDDESNLSDESEEEEEFVVEKIIGKRYNHKKNLYEYLLKWEGYPEDQSTWEPVNILKAVSHLVEEYEKQLLTADQNQDVIMSTSEVKSGYEVEGQSDVTGMEVDDILQTAETKADEVSAESVSKDKSVRKESEQIEPHKKAQEPMEIDHSTFNGIVEPKEFIHKKPERDSCATSLMLSSKTASDIVSNMTKNTDAVSEISETKNEQNGIEMGGNAEKDKEDGDEISGALSPLKKRIKKSCLPTETQFQEDTDVRKSPLKRFAEVERGESLEAKNVTSEGRSKLSYEAISSMQCGTIVNKKDFEHFDSNDKDNLIILSSTSPTQRKTDEEKKPYKRITCAEADVPNVKSGVYNFSKRQGLIVHLLAGDCSESLKVALTTLQESRVKVLQPVKLGKEKDLGETSEIENCHTFDDTTELFNESQVSELRSLLRASGIDDYSTRKSKIPTKAEFTPRPKNVPILPKPPFQSLPPNQRSLSPPMLAPLTSEKVPSPTNNVLDSPALFPKSEMNEYDIMVSKMPNRPLKKVLQSADESFTMERAFDLNEVTLMIPTVPRDCPETVCEEPMDYPPRLTLDPATGATLEKAEGEKTPPPVTKYSPIQSPKREESETGTNLEGQHQPEGFLPVAHASLNPPLLSQNEVFAIDEKTLKEGGLGPVILAQGENTEGVGGEGMLLCQMPEGEESGALLTTNVEDGEVVYEFPDGNRVVRRTNSENLPIFTIESQFGQNIHCLQLNEPVILSEGFQVVVKQDDEGSFVVQISTADASVSGSEPGSSVALESELGITGDESASSESFVATLFDAGELPADGSLRKVALMLPDGSVMVTEVTEEQFAALRGQ